jgi:predicted ATPase
MNHTSESGSNNERPRRYIITGGPAVGKAVLFEELRKSGYECSRGEIAREIYRAFKIRLGRHLEVGDRREYSLEVLQAFIDEYCQHKCGLYFYNRGIPDGFGWERFFGLGPSKELIEASRAYRYDGVFVLDSLTKFEDEKDVVWASDRDAARVHQLVIQGYIEAGYKPIFVPVDFVERRLKFILSNI